MVDLHPIGRVGQPKEVAGARSGVSGEVLVVDGGITTIYHGHGGPVIPWQGPTT